MIISYRKCSLRINPSRCLVGWLRRRFRWVRAAGGVVVDTTGRHLIIRRDGMWDLPKGMVEPNESLRQAALREVMEETGIAALQVGKPIMKTYHIYNKYGGWHLKQTCWFAMQCEAGSPTLPQTDEGITEVVWADPKVWHERMDRSFASLKLISKQLATRHTNERQQS